MNIFLRRATALIYRIISCVLYVIKSINTSEIIIPKSRISTGILTAIHIPVMQEMWRLYIEGKLEGDQLVMFQSPCPPEELYDVENDKYELNNLAEDAGHENVLKRMREALTAWQSEFGDMGNISEEEMVAQWYPNGTQPQTASPLFIPINASNPGTEPAHEDGEWDAPLLLQLYCSTQGASIAYTTEQGEDVRWQLYTEPLRLPKGETVIRAKAIRIGYKES